MGVTEAAFFVVSLSLFLIEILETIIAVILYRQLKRRPGGIIARIGLVVTIGITVSQALLVVTAVLLNVDREGTYPIRLMTIVLSQIIVVITMLYALYSLRRLSH